MLDANCHEGEHEACEAVLEYGECACPCHAAALERLARRSAADQQQRRAARIREVNGIPHDGR